ncbi:MAG: 50S ribosomal protein L32e [Promethearchaeota archaeon]|nr:MAG: 50S ribosomal protein L32e [Candidatus Lokiarchaeota archaeon]
MENNQRLMRIRAEKKKRRPAFVRVESWRRVKVKPAWRRARGIDNQTRHNTKKGVKSPGAGYRVPKKIRGLHPSGLEDIVIISQKELESLNPEMHGVRISARLGTRKRIALIDVAREKGFRVLNMGISRKELLELNKAEAPEEVEEVPEEPKKKRGGRAKKSTNKKEKKD